MSWPRCSAALSLWTAKAVRRLCPHHDVVWCPSACNIGSVVCHLPGVNVLCGCWFGVHKQAWLGKAGCSSVPKQHRLWCQGMHSGAISAYQTTSLLRRKLQASKARTFAERYASAASQPSLVIACNARCSTTLMAMGAAQPAYSRTANL